MAGEKDPTTSLRKSAAAMPSVTESTSCNQTSFKTGKQAFLFVGPGPKGVGFKAMFKLESSRPEAEQLAADQPDRFQVGSGVWVTTRFSADSPLPAAIWKKWLEESYELSRPRAGQTKNRSKNAAKSAR